MIVFFFLVNQGDVLKCNNANMHFLFAETYVVDVSMLFELIGSVLCMCVRVECNG